MMEQSKKSSLMVARSILNNKLISKKLEHYLKVRRGCLEPGCIPSPYPWPQLWSRESLLPLASVPFPQGENPFTDSPEEEKEQEEAESSALDVEPLIQVAGTEGAESTQEGAESTQAQPPAPPEPAPGAASPPPPPPPPEEDEEAVPLLGGALQREIRGIPGLDVEDDDDEEGGGGPP